MTSPLLALPDLLRDAGLHVRVLDGWDEPRIVRGAEYRWEEDGAPQGHMHHHTATNSYTPNLDKASLYAGLSVAATSRLFSSQSDLNGRGYPTIVVANAYPAPISSGYGVESVLRDFVQKDQQFVGDQPKAWTYRPDGTRWAGNRFYINTEWVLDGIGTWVDEEVWAMMVDACSVIDDLMGWSVWRNITHGQHTSRKIDLRVGQYEDHVATIEAFLTDLIRKDGETMFNHYEIGDVRKEYEADVSWLLAALLGLDIAAPPRNSAKILSVMPWKVSQTINGESVPGVRIVYREDLELVADLLGFSPTERQNLLDHGLYRYGWELGALRDERVKRAAGAASV